MSTTEDHPTKRRRIDMDDGDDEPDEVPSNVPSAACVASQTSGEQGTEVQLTDPKLDKIPAFLVQISTSSEAEDVAAAVASLMHLLDEDTCPADHRENKEEASFLGAHSFVIMAMRKWQRSESVQKNGCQFLNVLATGSYSTKSEVRNAMAGIGAIETCLDAMKLFPDNLSLFSFGVRTINNIFCTAEVVAKCGDRFLNQLDGVSIVVEAMKKHRDNPDFQRSTCKFLYKMTKYNGLRGDLLKSGAMSAVATAVEKHPENKDIKKLGTNFMKNILADDGE